MGANNRPKVEIGLNDSATLTLLKEKALVGENSYGPYFMYNVSEDGTEKVLFATADVHKQVLEAGLKTGDSFELKKVPVQNGKKVTAKVEFEVVSKQDGNLSVGGPDDGFCQLMKRCVEEAVSITKEVNSIPWQNEDVRGIALTMFIQRARGS